MQGSIIWLLKRGNIFQSLKMDRIELFLHCSHINFGCLATSIEHLPGFLPGVDLESDDFPEGDAQEVGEQHHGFVHALHDHDKVEGLEYEVLFVLL